MANIAVPKGFSVYLTFTVFGPRGPSASPPDIDITTVVTADQIGAQGEVAARLVTTDGATTRRLRVDVPPTASIGAGRGDVAVTARNKTAHQLVDVTAPPDLSEVQFGTAGAAFPTPDPSSPNQFP